MFYSSYCLCFDCIFHKKELDCEFSFVGSITGIIPFTNALVILEVRPVILTGVGILNIFFKIYFCRDTSNAFLQFCFQIKTQLMIERSVLKDILIVDEEPVHVLFRFKIHV